jgi:hypothetical protein
MACGDSYEVPLKYMLKWFAKPHYRYRNKNFEKWENNFQVSDSNRIIVACESVLKNGAIRVILNDSSVYEVAWDTVLMACEERYEHFGGLTEESKKTVNEWHHKNKW